MISSSRTDLISRSSKLQMYPDVWIGSCFFLKIQSIIATVYINVYIATVRQCSWHTNTWTFTSGSRFLKTYILVFSIMANRSGLSFAHFMSQTSLRSNLDGSPAAAWFPVMSSEEARTSRSNKVSTPAMSIMARRLRKIIHLIHTFKIQQLSTVFGLLNNISAQWRL